MIGDLLTNIKTGQPVDGKGLDDADFKEDSKLFSELMVYSDQQMQPNLSNHQRKLTSEPSVVQMKTIDAGVSENTGIKTQLIGDPAAGIDLHSLAEESFIEGSQVILKDSLSLKPEKGDTSLSNYAGDLIRSVNEAGGFSKNLLAPVANVKSEVAVSASAGPISNDLDVRTTKASVFKRTQDLNIVASTMDSKLVHNFEFDLSSHDVVMDEHSLITNSKVISEMGVMSPYIVVQKSLSSTPVSSSGVAEPSSTPVALPELVKADSDQLVGVNRPVEIIVAGSGNYSEMLGIPSIEVAATYESINYSVSNNDVLRKTDFGNSQLDRAYPGVNKEGFSDKAHGESSKNEKSSQVFFSLKDFRSALPSQDEVKVGSLLKDLNVNQPNKVDAKLGIAYSAAKLDLVDVVAQKPVQTSANAPILQHVPSYVDANVSVGFKVIQDSGDIKKPFVESTLADLPSKIKESVLNNQTALTLKLKPYELGRIDVQIKDVGGELQMSFKAEKVSTLDVLQSNESFLKSIFKDSDSLTLSYGGTGKDGSAKREGEGEGKGEGKYDDDALVNEFPEGDVDVLNVSNEFGYSAGLNLVV